MTSENKRLKILSLLSDGIICAEDAMKLLAAITQEELSAESQAQETDHDPQESVFCLPGGKCYTLEELKNLEKPTIPKIDLKGESGNAESKADRRDQQRD